MTVRQHPRPAQTRGIAAQRGRLTSVRRKLPRYKPVRTLALLPLRSPTRRHGGTRQPGPEITHDQRTPRHKLTMP